jgi:hypothetical protein
MSCAPAFREEQSVAAAQYIESRYPMGLFSKDIETMDDLVVHTLRSSTMPKIRFSKRCPI